MVSSGYSKLVVDITHNFLENWHPITFGKKSVYIRDTKVNILLCCFSKKGTHSWTYDYYKDGIHKSKVFGKFPAMSVKQAREKALAIKELVINEDKSYDEVFEITRHPSYVYFLENSDKLIKIGRSTDWMTRIAALTVSSEGVRFIGLRLETPSFSENILHALYRKYRQPNNEYFKNTKNLIKEMIVDAVVYNKSDKELSKLITKQENIIYETTIS